MGAAGGGLGGHGGFAGIGGGPSNHGGAGGSGGCLPFGLTDATGAGVTVGGGGAPPADGGTEPATVCIMPFGTLTTCQLTEALTETLGPCFQLVSVAPNPFQEAQGATCWSVVVQPLPCH